MVFARFRSALVLAAALLSLADAAAALTPQEVLVVVNARSPESVELGRYYCRQRGVPETNLVELDCTLGDTVDNDEYRGRILAPLRQAIEERGLREQVRCLLMIRGVPFRVGTAPVAAPTQALAQWSQRAAERSQGRLALANQLLRTVGRDFPDKAATAPGIDRLDALFDQASVNMPSNPPSGASSLAAFDRDLLAKIQAASRIADAGQRAIAERQLLGLTFEVRGLSGLLQLRQANILAGGPDAETLQRQLAALAEHQQRLLSGNPGPEDLEKVEQVLGAMGGIAALYQFSGSIALPLKHAGDRVALDSDISLLWWDETARSRFAQNFLHWRQAALLPRVSTERGRPLMVARLDGPNWEDLRRIIDDSIAVEQAGLTGRAYVDAGGMHPAYDVHLRELARLLREQTDLPVTLDEAPAVFRAGSCPEAALYVGWYSLRKYVASCAWTRGAVGFHIASFEAIHLRDADTQEWVPQMIRNGIAATVGPVDEPYLTAFPLPEEFFPLLLTGKVTLAEAYWRTVPHQAWRMLLIGDPLYAPFRANPQAVTLPEGLRP